MTHFADLSPYTYFPAEGQMVNVGWLSKDHPFTRGPVSSAFAHELQRLSRCDVENLTRGAHVCEFCEPPAEIIGSCPEYMEVWKMFRSGNGEIHIRSGSGVTYCAPALIVHYVAEHQYQPPAEFTEAVLFQRIARVAR